jgi:peroxiredoxin
MRETITDSSSGFGNSVGMELERADACLGCGAERHCRVAADDNTVACMRLPPTVPRRGKWAVGAVDEEQVA